MLLTVTSTGDGLFGFINIDELERHEPLKKRFLVNFSQFLDHHHHSEHQGLYLSAVVHSADMAEEAQLSLYHFLQ